MSKEPASILFVRFHPCTQKGDLPGRFSDYISLCQCIERLSLICQLRFLKIAQVFLYIESLHLRLPKERRV